MPPPQMPALTQNAMAIHDAGGDGREPGGGGSSDSINAIVLLHGYGGDGKDISILSLNWKRHLPNTIFIPKSSMINCRMMFG